MSWGSHSKWQRVVAAVIVFFVLAALVDTTMEYMYPKDWKFDVISTSAVYVVMIMSVIWLLLAYEKNSKKAAHMRAEGIISQMQPA